MKTLIGIDFGTQAARAILVDAATGKTLVSHAVSYCSGILPGDRAEPAEYEAALWELLEAMAVPEYRQTVAGIGVDATSCSLLLTDMQGAPLSAQPAFADNPYAKIQLWKRRTALAQAQQALTLAEKTCQPFLTRTGGSISPEWFLPKLMELHDEAPELLEAADLAFDLCDWLTCLLTGTVSRSRGSMSFKALWSEDTKYTFFAISLPPNNIPNSTAEPGED